VGLQLFVGTELVATIAALEGKAKVLLRVVRTHCILAVRGTRCHPLLETRNAEKLAPANPKMDTVVVHRSSRTEPKGDASFFSLSVGW
jgi:hypothetical protein